MPTRVVLCDSPDGLAQLQYALITSGAALEIEVATDGMRAVEACARTRPDIVVTELSLEGLAGAELIRRFLATTPQAKVICWASEVSASLVAETLEAGASAFVGKSEGPDAVFRAMRTVNAGSVALGPAVAGQVADGLRQEAGRVAELETALSEISEQLHSLTTAKADFLANVSHELRTPVTVAKGIAYVLKKRTLPEEEQDRFLGELEMALDKLTGLVEEMVTVAELDRGELTLELTDVDLAPLIRHVADEVGRRYADIVIEREIPDGLPGAADPVRFTEIVRQLLDNACRYSSKGAMVNVHGRPMDEGVLVSVTDHGEGVLRETVSKAFDEPFSAGEDILRKERAGAGIGLHLARQLVIGHGGILWADPLPAGGTRVSFVIPANTGERAVKPSGLVDLAPPPVELPPAPLREIAAIGQSSTRPTSP